MTDDSLFTRTDAAKFLEVSVSTIRLWETSGKLKAMKTVGGIRVFRQADCEKIASERQHKQILVAKD